VIRPEWHGEDGLALPHIHDLYLLAAAREPSDLAPVADLVASPAYQALPDGIGLLAIEGGRRLDVHGWLAHLPGLAEYAPAGGSPLLRLALAARYRTLAAAPGIVATRKLLDAHRTPEGRWRLPAHLLPEREGYWVSGAHLGLEDDRRRRVAREVESTVRVLDAG
jgi:hypothetical protein